MQGIHQAELACGLHAREQTQRRPHAHRARVCPAQALAIDQRSNDSDMAARAAGLHHLSPLPVAQGSVGARQQACPDVMYVTHMCVPASHRQDSTPIFPLAHYLHASLNTHAMLHYFTALATAIRPTAKTVRGHVNWLSIVRSGPNAATMTCSSVLTTSVPTLGSNTIFEASHMPLQNK